MSNRGQRATETARGRVDTRCILKLAFLSQVIGAVLLFLY